MLMTTTSANAVSSLAIFFATTSAVLAQAPVYPTPQAALEALVVALESENVDSAINTIDPDARDLVQSDDPAEIIVTMRKLLEQYRAGYRFVPNADGSVTIALGEEAWPFPVPLMKAADGWSFDAATARDEVRSREIGGNELAVIEILKTYVQIQSDYRKVDHDGDGVLEFAASIISSEGTHDGLYWPDGDSPVGDIAARASLDGYAVEGTDSVAEPLHGYYFRILTAQGPSAPGGEVSYLVNGNMLAGHAALAVPAVYGETGIQSFMISEAGTVFQADLGEQTLEVGFGMSVFDVTEGWQPVE